MADFQATSKFQPLPKNYKVFPSTFLTISFFWKIFFLIRSTNESLEIESIPNAINTTEPQSIIVFQFQGYLVHVCNGLIFYRRFQIHNHIAVHSYYARRIIFEVFWRLFEEFSKSYKKIRLLRIIICNHDCFNIFTHIVIYLLT